MHIGGGIAIGALRLIGKDRLRVTTREQGVLVAASAAVDKQNNHDRRDRSQAQTPITLY